MIDFGSIIELLYGLLSAAFFAARSVAVPFAVTWLPEKTKLDKLVGDDLTRNYLYEALERGILYAKTELDEKVESIDGNIDLGIDSPLVGIAVSYVLNAVPEGLERFGINDEDAVRRLVTARLEDVLNTTADPALADSAA